MLLTLAPSQDSSRSRPGSVKPTFALPTLRQEVAQRLGSFHIQRYVYIIYTYIYIVYIYTHVTYVYICIYIYTNMVSGVYFELQ